MLQSALPFTGRRGDRIRHVAQGERATMNDPVTPVKASS
jgi:hypothetical protein